MLKNQKYGKNRIFYIIFRWKPVERVYHPPGGESHWELGEP